MAVMAAFSVEQLVEQVHASPDRVVLAITGGGSRAVAELLQTPGASKTVLEAVIPYSNESLVHFLGGPCEQSCSAPTARAMATAAWMRALQLPLAVSNDPAEGGAGDLEHLAGVACTASLASDRPKRGPHRVHVAVQTPSATLTASLELTKGRRSRLEEEQLVSRLVLNHVAFACGVEGRLPLDLLEGEQILTTQTDAEPDWRELLLGRIDAFCCGTAPSNEEGPSSGVIFPGAFHPLHDGHRRMAETAEALTGKQVEFELSIENVDKPPLDYTEIARRAEQFATSRPLWLTRTPTFTAKSQLFPAATFVVGADTIRRIADPRYYGGDSAACRSAIARIAENGCRFLVFGRWFDGSFHSLADLELPAELKALCREVPEETCRVDISSTELRRQSKSRLPDGT